MTSCRLTFHRIHQDSQAFGSDDEHMVSRLFFTLEVDEERFEDLYCDVKQVVGGDYATGPLEVSPPASYSGPMNYMAFRNAAEDYYRSAFGGGGWAVSFGPGASDIRMRDNVAMRERAYEFDCED